MVRKIETDDEADENGDGAADQPLPKFLEVLEERHLLATELVILGAVVRVRAGRVLNSRSHTQEPAPDCFRTECSLPPLQYERSTRASLPRSEERRVGKGRG